jgi:hypothetical protein
MTGRPLSLSHIVNQNLVSDSSFERGANIRVTKLALLTVRGILDVADDDARLIEQRSRCI